MDSHTVFIVDDDADIRESVAEALEDEGYNVKMAANGKEALDLLAVEPSPCLILLDLMMPVMDGQQFRLAQQSDPAWAAIPVVLVSAGNQGKETAREMGAADFLRKPFKMKELFEKVERLC